MLAVTQTEYYLHLLRLVGVPTLVFALTAGLLFASYTFYVLFDYVFKR